MGPTCGIYLFWGVTCLCEEVEISPMFMLKLTAVLKSHYIKHFRTGGQHSSQKLSCTLC